MKKRGFWLRIKEFLQYFSKNYLLAVIVLVVFLSITLFVYFKSTPVYYSSLTFMLGANREKDNLVDDIYEKADVYFYDYQTNDKILENYVALIKSEENLEKTIQDNNLDYSIYDLMSMIKISYKDSTHYFLIEVTSKKKDANKIVYALYKTFYEENKEVFSLNNTYLVDYNDAIYRINYKNTILRVGISLSFIICIGVILIKYIFLKDTINLNFKDIIKMYKRRKHSKKLK